MCVRDKVYSEFEYHWVFCTTREVAKKGCYLWCSLFMLRQMFLAFAVKKCENTAMNPDLKRPVTCPLGDSHLTYPKLLQPVMMQLATKHEDWCVTVSHVKPCLRSEVYCLEQLQMYINAHVSADISDQGRLAFFREVLTPCCPIDIEGLTNEIDPDLLDFRDIHPSEFPHIDLAYVYYVQFVSLSANEEVARPWAVNID